jgi:HK97 family phage prohead protease
VLLLKPKLRHVTVQVRALPADDAPPGTVRALVSSYDVEYDIGGGRRERIKPDALYGRRESIPLFYEHDWAHPIGVARAGSQEEGFLIDGRLFIEDPLVRSLHELTKEDALSEWSIGFLAEEFDTEASTDDLDVVSRGQVVEASLVVMGANPGTATLDVRHAEKDPEEKADPPAPEAPSEEQLTLALADAGWREVIREQLTA